MALVLAVTLVMLGCSHGLEKRVTRPLVARGPGAVFASVEAAAIDALAWSYIQAQGDRSLPRRVRGGTIVAFDDGYRYAPPVTASREEPFEVRYALTRDVVAHYRMQPSTGESRLDRSLARASARERRIVDGLDPSQRPFYLLTPELNVRVYQGRERGSESIARLVRDRNAHTSARFAASELEARVRAE